MWEQKQNIEASQVEREVLCGAWKKRSKGG